MTTEGGYGPEPSIEEVRAMPGAVVLDFGTDWCGHCAAARPGVEAVLARRPDVRHLRVEDGRGRPLGRAYRVKLWPTLVLLREGEEVARIVRPTRAQDVEGLLLPLSGADASHAG